MSLIRDAFEWVAQKCEDAHRPMLLHENRFCKSYYRPSGSIETFEKQRPATIVTVPDPMAFVQALRELERTNLQIHGEMDPVVYISDTNVVGYLGLQDLYHFVQLPLRFNPLWKQLESLHEKTFEQSQLARFLRTIWRSVDTNGGMRNALAKIEVTRRSTENRELTSFKDKGMREFANEMREEIPDLYTVSCPVFDIPYADRPQTVEVVLDFDLAASPLSFRLFPRPESLLDGKRRALKQLHDVLRTAIDEFEPDGDSTLGQSTQIIYGSAGEVHSK